MAAVVVAVKYHCVSIAVVFAVQLSHGVVVPTLDALVSGALDASLGMAYAPASATSEAAETAMRMQRMLLRLNFGDQRPPRPLFKRNGRF